MIEYAFASVLGLILLVVAVFLRPQWALAVSVALGVLQFYFFQQLAVSLGALWFLATWATVFRHRRSVRISRPIGIAYAALVVVSVAALAWSPDRAVGATLVAQLLGLGATVALASIVAGDLRASLHPALLALAALSLVSGASIVCFRILPQVEHAFFVSPAFGLFNGNDLAAHFFTTQRNNALDVAKSGGFFFVNANVAGLFSGASAFVALAGCFTADRVRSRAGLALVAGVGVVAAFATGSKTAFYLAVAGTVLIGAAMLLTRADRPVAPRRVAGGVLVLAAAAALVVSLAPRTSQPDTAAASTATTPPSSTAPTEPIATPTPVITQGPPAPADLSSQSVDALGTRVRIWRVAAQVFEQRPYGAFGYGGWSEVYGPRAAASGLNPAFPPHNWVIAAWADTGLLGTALTIVLVLLSAWTVIRTSRRTRGSERLAAFAVGIALGWIVLHGLGDNTGFAGGPRLIPVVGCAFAVLVLLRTRGRREDPAGPAAISERSLS